MNPEKLPSKLSYIRAIIRNRLNDKNYYFNEGMCTELLGDAYTAGVSLEQLEDLAKSIKLKTWTDFRDALIDLTTETEQRKATPPEYPFSEFLTHYDDIHAILEEDEERSFMATVQHVSDYFKDKIAEHAERQYKQSRLWLVMLYAADHLNDFDQGDFAVYGSKRVGGLISEHLLHAIHHFYTTHSVAATSPSPEEIMRIAHELRE